MPYTHEHNNTLQMSLNLLERTVRYLDAQRGEEGEKHKTGLQEDIEHFILLQSKPRDTYYDTGNLH